MNNHTEGIVNTGNPNIERYGVKVCDTLSVMPLVIDSVIPFHMIAERRLYKNFEPIKSTGRKMFRAEV